MNPDIHLVIILLAIKLGRVWPTWSLGQILNQQLICYHAQLLATDN